MREREREKERERARKKVNNFDFPDIGPLSFEILARIYLADRKVGFASRSRGGRIG